MELMWTLARYAPQAVLEANFRPRSEYERSKLVGLKADIVEVHCDCGVLETARRFRDRAAASGHHAAHPLKELSEAMLAEYDQPVGLGAVIAVNTLVPADIESIALEILRVFR